ncbi:hydrolase [Lactobacillus pentosus] [Lactiplantibacillus mudanjiangensis]|uniref:alpha/beta hydrolase n=1 Tax=Lactiplantibacillus mudanjiangensis TaxID=1296538 RepID=UPI0010143A1D|nr:hydrolase [Lactobacillus pentosus] [Lactiplantibacillus mudanjiangensis]
MSKKILVSLLACGAFLLLIIGLGLSNQLHSDQASHVISSQRRPLILIPGSDSTSNDFDVLIKQLNAQQTHPIVKLTVTKDQQLKFQEIRTKDTPLNDTIIVVHFENSRDNNETIVEQTNGLAAAITYLHKRLGLKTANALGYSNGGLILSRYLAGLSDKTPLSIRSIMLVGTPFIGTNTNQPDTTLFKPLKTHRQAFKSLHAVVNVAGDTGQSSDGIVPVSSVQAGQQLFMQQAQRYTQMTVNEAGLSHTNFLQQRYLARLVRQNLLNQ